MNLVQNEASPPGIKAHLVEVQKFFWNHHKQSAQLKEKGGLRPQLPGDTRYTVQSSLDLECKAEKT